MITQLSKGNGHGPYLHSAVSELFDIDNPTMDGGAPFVGFSETYRLNPSQWFSRIPSANIKETHDDFKIEMAVPGLTRKDISIEVDNKLITINIVKDKEEVKEGERYTRREYNYLNTSRSFLLSHLVETNNIVAKCENGILTLELPKIAEAKKSQKKKLTVL